VKKQDTSENLVKTVYLAIGSNLGNKINNIERELFFSMIAISENKKVPYNNPSLGCSIKWRNDG